MEQFRKFGQIARQHYEKLILSAALLIFAVAVYYLYQDSIKQRQAIRDIPKGFDNLKVKGVTPVDLADNAAALKDAERPPVVDLSHPHLLYNPLQWESRGGGPVNKLKTANDVGPMAMQIAATRPIHLSVAYGSVSISGSDADAVVAGYWVLATNEMFAAGSLRRVTRAFLAPNDGKTNTPVPFVLRKVEGDPKEPTALIGELKDAPGEFSFGPNKPWMKTLGHEAELRYKPSGKAYPGLRVGATVDIDGQNYKVVDIDPTRVVLSDDSNGKQYTITRFVTP